MVIIIKQKANAKPIFQEITLPYHDNELKFNTEETFEFYDSESGQNTLARGFKFTLAESCTLSIMSFNSNEGWTAYRSLYNSYSEEEGLGERIDYSSYSSSTVDLVAGTYYLILDDDDYGDGYTCAFDIRVAPAAVSLSDALDAATEITYTDELSYIDQADVLPILCEGVGVNDETKYCAVYKITLAEGNKITIKHYTSDDAYLYVYIKSDDNYSIYGSNDDGGEDTDSEMVLSIGEGEDNTYYIVATTYENESPESYIFKVFGKEGVEPTTGVSRISNDSNVSVYGANGVISVAGAAEGETIVVYNMYGAVVAKAVAAEELTTVNVSNSGMYIVRVGNKGYKIAF